MADTPTVAQEAIAHQDGSFFKELTQLCEDIKGFGSEMTDKSYFISPPVKAILTCIKKRTGMTIAMQPINIRVGPAIQLPQLGGNHIFHTQSMREALAALEWDYFDDTIKALRKQKRLVMEGTVDLKHSVVTGIFTEIDTVLHMPREMLYGDVFKASEIAAIILHEVGHLFTAFEFLTRSFTTNQALYAVASAIDAKLTPDQLHVVIAITTDALRMSEEDKKALEKAVDSKDQVAVIIANAAICDSVSELGASVFDVNSCEFLADQFATRHGAGRDLATALDRSHKLGGFKERSAGYYLIAVIQWISYVLYVNILAVCTLGLVWLLLLFSCDRSEDIYGSDKGRFERIRQQNIDQLKNPYLSFELKKQLLDDNATIDKICQAYKDNLSVIEKINYFFRSSFRNQVKYERLQRDLETLGNNTLFEHAAAFSLALH